MHVSNWQQDDIRPNQQQLVLCHHLASLKLLSYCQIRKETIWWESITIDNQRAEHDHLYGWKDLFFMWSANRPILGMMWQLPPAMSNDASTVMCLLLALWAAWGWQGGYFWRRTQYVLLLKGTIILPDQCDGVLKNVLRLFPHNDETNLAYLAST